MQIHFHRNFNVISSTNFQSAYFKMIYNGIASFNQLYNLQLSKLTIIKTLFFLLVFHISKLNHNWIFVTCFLVVLKQKEKRSKIKFNPQTRGNLLQGKDYWFVCQSDLHAVLTGNRAWKWLLHFLICFQCILTYWYLNDHILYF